MVPVKDLTKAELVNIANFRCEHRHSGLDHYECWLKARGLEQNWCVLDLETSNLNAPFGILLCWGIKVYGQDEVYQGWINREDLYNTDLDKRVVFECVERLKQYETVITYFGTGFDVRWLRAKALHYNLDFPVYGTIKHLDVYYMVRRLLKLGRSSLESACDYLGIAGKTKIKWDNWLAAMCRADAVALADIADHNKKDLEITERCFDRLRPFVKLTKRSI